MKIHYKVNDQDPVMSDEDLVKRYRKEIAIMKLLLDEPIDRFPTRTLYDQLLSLITRSIDDGLYTDFDEEFFALAKDIFERGIYGVYL